MASSLAPIISATEGETIRTHTKGRPPSDPRKHDKNLVLKFGKVVNQFVNAVAEGQASEIACFGTRGDGKTFGVLGAMFLHAMRHELAGYPLPVIWMGVTDTFASHKLKTIPSMEKPFWKGAWEKRDGGHLMVGRVGGREYVHLHLFGIEDQGAMDRVRMEVHGVWFEEPAPAAVLVQSTGVDETAWSIALTSRRCGYGRDEQDREIPGSVAYPAVMTLNYPDEDHWTWQRFQPGLGVRGTHPADPARMWFRIPPGERASEAQRREWAHALRDRPDILRRLIEGQPGTLLMGAQVAEGFREDCHVASERIYPIDGEPLLLGQDFGHTPTTIIGQPWRGQRRVYAALTCERGGVKQHLEEAVIPWLSQYAPWTLQDRRKLIGCYDPAGQTGEQSDIERDPISTLESMLGGLWYPGPVKWESRKHVLISAMNHHWAAGKPSLVIDPVDGMPLIRALSGRWFYPTDRLGQVRRDLPKKPNHPWEDLGDAFIYWLWGLTAELQPPGPVQVETHFDLARPGVEVVSTW